MSDKYGILLAEDGKSIRQGRNKLDSRRKTLILDLEADPPHMNIVEVMGGNTYTDNAGEVHHQDALFPPIKHGLGFVPLVDIYFYIESVDGGTSDTAVGGYSGQFYPLSGTLSTVQDAVTYEVDEQELRIVHNFDTFGATTGYVSPANRYKFRVKYYIYSIDTRD